MYFHIAVVEWWLVQNKYPPNLDLAPHIVKLYVTYGGMQAETK